MNLTIVVTNKSYKIIQYKLKNLIINKKTNNKYKILYFIKN